MNKSGFNITTIALLVFGTVGIFTTTDVYAASQNTQKSQIISNDEMQAKIKARKESILKKISQMKSSTTTEAPTSVTILDSKPKQIYTLTRMIDYSPHPTTENILKDKPIAYNGNNYYFTVTYKEGWKDISASEACLDSICFNINVYENGKKVRDLTTPKVNLKAKNIKKGQPIGIAEISPFKFNIKLEKITKNAKGISDLTFKLELIG